MMDVTVDVQSLVIGGPSGPIHMVDLPVHSPASFASSSCILPGVPAAMQAFMSSMVQPGGSFISGWPDLAESSRASFDASALASEAMRMAAESVAKAAKIAFGRDMRGLLGSSVRCWVLSVGVVWWGRFFAALRFAQHDGDGVGAYSRTTIGRPVRED